ncbi:uncharacterized protein LOC120786071 isoform X2 [Xiphias gladius]|uniref:uncharacterized protein LOC120786071 isoform X2 n=1 Tax=Xiphias gladius TaxID=8245 RepID=UPI001A9838A6|nr:uncharacterized protein LOC120786071 isoform X2 [Xiphias gladius]
MSRTDEVKYKVVKEKKSITLSCPHSTEGKVIWSIEKGQGGKVDILTAGGDAGRNQSQDQGERYTSLADKSLHISRAVVSDSGRYFCNGQLVVQLSVIPSAQRTRPTATSAPKTSAANTVSRSESTSDRPPRTYQRQLLVLVLGIASALLLLLLAIIIIIVLSTSRCGPDKPGNEERHPVYEEIKDGCACHPTQDVESSAGPKAAYCMITLPGRSSHVNPL